MNTTLDIHQNIKSSTTIIEFSLSPCESVTAEQFLKSLDSLKEAIDEVYNEAKEFYSEAPVQSGLGLLPGQSYEERFFREFGTCDIDNEEEI